MSSFIGHGLAGVTSYGLIHPKARPFQSKKGAMAWLSWLIVLSWVPDLDYVMPSLHMANNHGMRITHSLFFSLLLPALTGLVLYVAGLRHQRLTVAMWQSAIAGLSHPIMDWWVGVIGLPLFWPLNNTVITAPIGLLPSAGSPHWQNYYFYYNLLIELGIVMPLMVVVLRNLPWQNNNLKLWQSVVLIAIATYFLHWSVGLSR